jgi:LDH2 family malate/lactate/ureidoglycolate dehydrogenase
MLGTNPLAIAFPGYKEPPIVIDMATSAVAYGKIEIALRKREPVPKGWIIDKNGRDTTNPQDMIDGGAQLPLGSIARWAAIKVTVSLPWSTYCAAF